MNHFLFSQLIFYCLPSDIDSGGQLSQDWWMNTTETIVNLSNYLIGLIMFICHNYSKTTNKNYAAVGEYGKIDEFNWIFCFQINTPESNNVLLTLNLICKINLFKIIHWCFILTLLRKFWSVRKNICQKCCTRLAILTTFSSIHNWISYCFNIKPAWKIVRCNIYTRNYWWNVFLKSYQQYIIS